MPANTAQTKRFLGLNNVSDALRLKFGWLQKADNMNITDTGALVRRDGFSKALTAVPSGAYATEDFSRMYLVDAGELKQVFSPTSTVTLKSGLSTHPMHWAEANEQVYFNNGVDSGIILKDGTVRDWHWTEPTMPALAAIGGGLPAGVYQAACTTLMDDGRETGASDAAAVYLNGTQGLRIDGLTVGAQVYIAPADSTVFQYAFVATGTSMTWNGDANELGLDLNTQFLDPLPKDSAQLAYWRGQMYAAQVLDDSNATAIWYSEPLGFHLFNLNENFFLVPGRVTMLAAHDEGLLIGTEHRIYSYDGEKLDELADYGVVPGYGWARDGKKGQIYFWTKRGLCSALPFSNLTLRQISVDCGLTAGAAIIQQNGAKRYVVALQQGGDNFNQRGT